MAGSGHISQSNHHSVGAPRPTVIVADGDPAVRHSLSFLLEIDGYAVTTHADSAAVIDDPGLHMAVCLIVDLNLGDMNGLELVDTLRGQSRTIPVVLMASNVDQKILNRSQTAGIQVVEKPIFGDVLNQAIKAAVHPH